MSGELINQNRKRAEKAYAFVKANIPKDDVKKQKEFKAECRNLPSLFQNNSSITVILHKKSKSTLLYDMLNDWIMKHDYIKRDQHNNLIELLLHAENKKIMQIDRELKELAIWICRSAEALMEK